MKRTYPHWLYDCELEKMVECGIITCEKTGKVINGRTIWKDVETQDEYVLWRKGRGEFGFVK